jgi:hypothetical protein
MFIRYGTFLIKRFLLACFTFSDYIFSICDIY